MFVSRISSTLAALRPSTRNTLRTFATSNVKNTNQNRVIGGLKATLHNPKASEEAKEHASERIEELTGSPAPGESSDASQQHKNHVLGGYKATLNNPRTSEDAKKHAREILEAEGVQTEGLSADEHDTRVIAGYKAALHNPRVSEEAKKHAREYLKEHNVQ